MNLYFFNHRKKILLIGISFLLCGIILAYVKWGVEPEETIAGVFCGIGVSMILFPLSLKKE